MYASWKQTLTTLLCHRRENLWPHLKLKHRGGNKKVREALAISYIIAKLNGKPLPDIKFLIPPTTLAKIATKCKRKVDLDVQQLERLEKMDTRELEREMRAKYFEAYP